MKTIVATNIRGGCGKTTNVLHLAIAASKAKRRNRVLCIDLDPQAHLSYCLCPDAPVDESVYIDYALTCKEHQLQRPLKTAYKNLELIPARMDLTRLQGKNLSSDLENRGLLGKLILEMKHTLTLDYDYVFIDTPAAYFTLHTLALAASDAYVISMRPEAFSLKGFAQSIEEIEKFKTNLRLSNPVFAGCFLNGVPKAKRKAIDRIREVIAEDYTSNIYEIPQSSLFDEARWSDKTSIFLFPGASHLQKCYVNTWNDLSKFLGA